MADDFDQVPNSKPDDEQIGHQRKGLLGWLERRREKIPRTTTSPTEANQSQETPSRPRKVSARRPAAASEKIIRNLTAKKIGIERTFPREEQRDAPKRYFVIPPFGERLISEEETPIDVEEWEQQNLVEVIDVNEIKLDETISLAIGCLIWVFLLGIPLVLLVPAWRTPSLIIMGALTVGILGYSLLKDKMHFVRRWLTQAINLILILVIGIGLPAFVIYFFGGGRELLFSDRSGSQLALLGRGIQLAFISIASLLPALLYFLFDRQKLKTLRDGFFRNVIHLDPAISTLKDAESLYGKRVEEIYGTEEKSRGKGRFMYGSRAPILVTTLIIVIGWLFVFLPAGDLPPDFEGHDLPSLFTPQWTAVNFGFLGSYFFAINMILRRYVRADLKPKAYSHIAVRILTVLILVWATSMIPIFWDNVSSGISGVINPALTEEQAERPAVEEQSEAGAQPLLFLFAFFIGIVPETGTALLQDYLRSQKRIGSRIPSLQEKLPLNQLEGINLYERARLLEEGIENIENLVHHDLIDLLLQTRIPVPRLVDWLDQGILYLHLAGTQTLQEDSTGDPSELKKSMQILRRYGIRTATDLLSAYEAKKDKEDELPFLRILDEPNDTVMRLQVILDTLVDDEWMRHIRTWRDTKRFEEVIHVLDEQRGLGLRTYYPEHSEEPMPRPLPEPQRL